MKRIKHLTLAALLMTTASAWATEAAQPLEQGVKAVQKQWAMTNYETPKDKQEKAFEALTRQARDLVAAYPDNAEPKVWLAIVLSSDAGATGGLGALGKVKEARKFLEAAEKIDPNALNGSVYTSLGSLYYQVPGWPIGFGNDDKAEQYLKKALSVNPDGIDPNYFYGDFLIEEGRANEAIAYLHKAQQAAPRPGREIADKGRQAEISTKLAKAQQMLSSNNDF